MFVIGSDVVNTVTNEIVAAEELGGARTHTAKSFVADGAFKNNVEALEHIRLLFDFLPLNNRKAAPVRPFFDDPGKIETHLDTLIPDSSNKALEHTRNRHTDTVVDPNVSIPSRTCRVPCAFSSSMRDTMKSLN